MKTYKMPVTAIGLVQKLAATLVAAKAHAYDAMEAAASARYLGSADQKIEVERLEDNALEVVRLIDESLETAVFLEKEERCRIEAQTNQGRAEVAKILANTQSNEVRT